jgi:signal transduction histidine kinase
MPFQDWKKPTMKVSFKGLNKKNLFFSFLAAFLIVSIVPLLLSGYRLLTRTQDELKSSLNENNYLVARHISNKLDEQQIEKWISALDGLSSSLAWNGQEDPDRRGIIINSYFSQIRELVILSTLSRSGLDVKHYVNQNLLNKTKGWNTENLASLLSFRNANPADSNGVIIRTPVFFDSGKSIYLPIDVVQKHPGKTGGSLRGVFQLDPVFGFIDADMSSMQRQIYILDDTRRILFQNINGQFGPGRVLPYPIRFPLQQNSFVFQTLHFEYSGKKYVSYLLPTPRTGWFVVVAYLYEKAYAPVSQIRRQLVMNLGFALVLSVLMSFLFAWFHSSVIHHAKETLQRYAEKLEQSNAELEAFAYSISHELSAPLRHIMSYTDVLGMRLGSTLDSKSQHQLQNISDAAKNLSELVYNVLLFSRVGYADITKRRIDMNQMVQLIQSKLETDIGSRKISWKITGNTPLWGDPVMLQQVMFNLISNAVKFTRHRKRAVIQIDTHLEMEEVIASVRDNGVGFDMKDINRLFGLFQRLHDKDTFEGSGVGLAHVRRIVAKHGGRTWAEGELGHGSTFYFSLPAEPTSNGSRKRRRVKG